MPQCWVDFNGGLQSDRSDPEDRKRRAGFSGEDERELDKGCIYTSGQNVVCMQICYATIDKSDYVLCVYAWSLTHSFICIAMRSYFCMNYKKELKILSKKTIMAGLGSSEEAKPRFTLSGHFLRYTNSSRHEIFGFPHVMDAVGSRSSSLKL